jgi:GxxExxY protein
MQQSFGTPLSKLLIGAAIEVHRQLGPGLLESSYEECLCFELAQRGVAHERQIPLPIVYKGHRLDAGYRIDLVVERTLIVEVKSVDQLVRIHEAQVLTYLRLSGLETALLINFNEVLLKDGLRRFALSSSARSASSAVDLLAVDRTSVSHHGKTPIDSPPSAPARQRECASQAANERRRRSETQRLLHHRLPTGVLHHRKE